MILHSLVKYYEDLCASDKISQPGWSMEKVKYGLQLADDGSILQLLPLYDENDKKKPARLFRVPEHCRRQGTGSFSEANFLCDNSSYILGVDSKGKPERAKKCFEACKALHKQLLEGIDSPAGKAALAFFETWVPENAAEHPALIDEWKDLIAGGNIILWYGDAPIYQNAEVKTRWQKHYDLSCSEGEEIRCLVTGDRTVQQRVHNVIKGVAGAQASGGTLVGFNEEAFRSYGMEQKQNVPIGKYAAFAYTTALNYLLADKEHTGRIGENLTVVCWAAGGETAYQELGMWALFGGDDIKDDRERKYTADELLSMFLNLARGNAVEWNEKQLDPNTNFCVLGLSPNNARLSVRFFWQNTFGTFAKNIAAHYERLEIAKPLGAGTASLTVWRLLFETVNKNAKKPAPTPLLSGTFLNAVLNDTLYPSGLHNGVIIRIRAERNINWGRAAILKANLIKNHTNSPNSEQLKEVTQVELNENCNYLPYVLGRLFSVMEKIQDASAGGNLNRTIKDSYFNAAASTPKDVFAKLFPLNEYHTKKLMRDKPGYAVVLGREKAELVSKITSPLPSRFTPEETDCFYIGYYHQTYKTNKTNKNKEDK